jgi:hypothetical protein
MVYKSFKIYKVVPSTSHGKLPAEAWVGGILHGRLAKVVPSRAITGGKGRQEW